MHLPMIYRLRDTFDVSVYRLPVTHFVLLLLLALEGPLVRVLPVGAS